MAKLRVVVSDPFVGLLYMQLCAETDATDSELLDVANRDNPSGTSLGWAYVVREDEGEPVPCADDSTRTHFLVGC